MILNTCQTLNISLYFNFFLLLFFCEILPQGTKVMSSFAERRNTSLLSLTLDIYLTLSWFCLASFLHLIFFYPLCCLKFDSANGLVSVIYFGKHQLHKVDIFLFYTDGHCTLSLYIIPFCSLLAMRKKALAKKDNYKMTADKWSTTILYIIDLLLWAIASSHQQKPYYIYIRRRYTFKEAIVNHYL